MSIADFSIEYDKQKNIVFAKVINKFVNLNDPKIFNYSTKKIYDLLMKHNCRKLFADYSLIGINMVYEHEYYYAKNFNKVFAYPEGTVSVIYEGEFYTEKKWQLIRKIFKEDGVDNVEIFSDYNSAMEWLLNK